MAASLRQPHRVERLPGSMEAGFGEFGADAIPAVAEETVVGTADQALGGEPLDLVAGTGQFVSPDGRHGQQAAQQQATPA